MKKRIAAALVTLAALVAASVIAGGPAQATTPQTVTITLLRNGPPDRAPVGWSSTGAFTDSGSWTIDRFICGACPAPIEGAFNFETSETGTGGTFQMRILLEFNQSQEQDLWEITGGTGAYTGLRGHGTWTLFIDDAGVRHIVCTGEVNFD
jgi:hypothetical protein